MTIYTDLERTLYSIWCVSEEPVPTQSRKITLRAVLRLNSRIALVRSYLRCWGVASYWRCSVKNYYFRNLPGNRNISPICIDGIWYSAKNTFIWGRQFRLLSADNLYYWVIWLFESAGESSIANIDALRHKDGTEPSAKVRLEIQKTMQNYAAVFRTGEVVSLSV